MTNNSEFKLVNGTFTEEDAKEILLHFFSQKIKFHCGRQFSLYERLGINCEFSEKRTEELKRDKQDIIALMKQAKLTGKNIKINADIQIELVEEDPTIKDGKIIDASLV